MSLNYWSRIDSCIHLSFLRDFHVTHPLCMRDTHVSDCHPFIQNVVLDGGCRAFSASSLMSSWEGLWGFSPAPAVERRAQLHYSRVACMLTFTFHHSLSAFLLFWSGKHMRDSNLHFNYIAEVIRCYLALVIECALRQPSTTEKLPLESHSLSVCSCVWVQPICVCLCTFVYCCVYVCGCVWDWVSWRNREPSRQTDTDTGNLFYLSA